MERFVRYIGDGYSDRMRAIRLAAATTALALATGLAGCAAPAEPEGPRALTEEEAQLLAVVRLNNLREGTRSVSIQVPDQATVEGYADFATHLGYGRMLDPAGPPVGLVSWNLGAVALLNERFPELPFPIPEGDWQLSALDPSVSKLAAALAVVLNLADDRADNYLLLQQEGGLYVRDDTIDGVTVVVLRGPSGGGTALLDYWVDDTGLVHRVDITFDGPEPTVILFGPAGDVKVPAVPGSEAPPASG